jgi:hypothetical protein
MCNSFKAQGNKYTIEAQAIQEKGLGLIKSHVVQWQGDQIREFPPIFLNYKRM